jgi:hypothetical protein
LAFARETIEIASREISQRRVLGGKVVKVLGEEGSCGEGGKLEEVERMKRDVEILGESRWVIVRFIWGLKLEDSSSTHDL